jgi:hypothetical protein
MLNLCLGVFGFDLLHQSIDHFLVFVPCNHIFDPSQILQSVNEPASLAVKNTSDHQGLKHVWNILKCPVDIVQVRHFLTSDKI